MPSYLTFASTQRYRDVLLARNLSPYTVPGVYTPPPVSTIVRDTVQTVSSVIDSPDDLIFNDPFADLLYPLNIYGPSNGYNKNIGIRWLTNTRSNEGPYNYSRANLPQRSLPIEREIPTLNKYAPQNVIQLISINNIQSVPTFKQYADPLNFVPSTYTPYQILLQDNPTGDNGSLTQDSFIAQLGAKRLRKEFEDRIGRELNRNTLGRINLPNAISDPVQAIQLLQGKRPLIERDWVITRSQNVILKATDFAARLAGFNYPGSQIPGDYFQTDEQNLSLFGQIAGAFNGGKDPRGGFLGKVMGRFLSQPSPSQLFLNNTGGGQKSQLYYNLGFNRYSPEYNKSLIGQAVDLAKSAINSLLDLPTKGGYYVGSKELNPSRIDSPAGEVPLNPFGQETNSPVYGPDVLSKEYEGEAIQDKFQIGFDGRSYSDGGGLSGGLIWTSPKYNNAGFKARIGGDQGPTDSEYNQVKSQTESYLSQGFNFKQSSIMDNTQRIIDSTPDGGKRLSHVGNAINQLSKVFNDGYKEITKGSQVLSFKNPKKGIHTTDNVYCRVFTKDTPYYTFADLQKTEGNIRKFTYSILDNTYNLNIAPTKNPGSTNIVNGQVKKYMFSIENLAWRTSNREGITVNDLPECERGPNGGRVMWFPPYDISFNETVTPTFSENNFLGRPEPIYTYSNTKRTGSLSWKIIVDHPSILNVIAQKELKNESNTKKINDIVDSFFAGCLKYDIYELARRWNTIPTDQLFIMQQTITNPRVTREEVVQVATELPPVSNEKKVTEVVTPDLKAYQGFAFYFDNDIPTPQEGVVANTDYLTTYNAYIAQKSTYAKRAGANSDKVSNFFTEVIQYNFSKTEELISKIQDYFKNFQASEGSTTKPSVTITLKGSASAPNKKAYNVNLSKRRIDSVQKYLKQTALKEYFDNGSLKIAGATAEGEDATVTPISSGAKMGPETCTDDDKNNLTEYERLYSPKAMACRRAAIDNIDFTQPEPLTTITPNPTETQPGKKTPPGYTASKPLPPTISTTQKIRDGISKKILRFLLSECDYFEVIKESNPMFYDSMKEKIRYFNPAFHSMTPEGLNSRLTFLQQCMRPGDTIPIIGTDGKPKYTSSVNTNFGAPPVLILRVGDFYNSKIIPTSLQIQYDPLVLDMNPEGIGVQPMIAKVTMSFNFVGGEGLKGPIDRLQNALSFNYYANTEMYDERAEATDDSYKKIDEALVKAILDNSPVVGINDTNNNIKNEGGNTIGVIENKIVNTSGNTSGSTSYQKVMDGFFDNSQKYMDTVLNKTKQITNDFNLPLAQLFTTEVNYSSGKAIEFGTPTPIDLKIYGKPDNVEQRVKSLYDEVVKDINGVTSSTSAGFDFINKLYELDFSEKKIINVVKQNLIKALDTAQKDIITALSQTNQTTTDIQQSLVRLMSKIDFVVTNSDGYIKSDQTTKIYNITATTEVQSGGGDTYTELVNDYSSGVTQLYSFYNELKNQKLVEYKFKNDDIQTLGKYFTSIKGTPYENPEKRFYTLMSRVIINGNYYATFRDSVITPNIANELDKKSKPLIGVFNEEFQSRRNELYTEEHNEEVKYLDKLISDKFATYSNSFTQLTGKTRKFTFSDYASGSTVQSTRLQNLYKDGNSNPDKTTFNGKNKFN
jgi:hypothetical protein